MTAWRCLIAGAWLVSALAGCAPAPGAQTNQARSPESTEAERSYSAPPAVVGAQRLTGGRVLLSGVAPAMVRVRLASPAGVANFTSADRAGAWRLVLPAASDLRLFGLSASRSDRSIQAEGYLAVTPNGLAAQLRAGSGAVVLDGRQSKVAVLAADFDRKGGVVLSGMAPPGATISLAVDGATRGPTRAGADGRYLLALNEPLRPGDHVLAVASGGENETTALTISPAEPLTTGPFRAYRAPGAWRVDWLTPGGGVQSTVLFDLAEPGS